MTEHTIILAQKATPPVPVIPKPVTTAPPPPPPPPSNAQAAMVQPQGGLHIGRDLPLTSWDIAVVSAVTLLVALLALIPRSLITRSLVAQRATPGSANSAGWAAWLLCVVTTFVLLIGGLGGFWTVLLFWAPASIAFALLLFLTLALYFRARRTHR